jgi:predicted nucleic-acid-binding Zn-ribbon protein
MTIRNVTELIRQYKASQDQKVKELAITALAEYLYVHLRYFKLDYLTEDKRSDFIVFLYPRFPGIIERFDEGKSALITYLRWIVHLSYRTFTRERYIFEARQQVFATEEGTRLLSIETEQSNSQSWNEIAGEDQKYYTARYFCESRNMTQKQKEIFARTIFLLACKSGVLLEDPLIEQISNLTGYTSNYIRTNLEFIQDKNRTRNEKLAKLKEVQNNYYIRCQRCLYELKYIDKQKSRYLELETEYRFCIKRLSELKTKAEKINRGPSNRFLAKLLGMSRVTIDGTLASVRNRSYLEPS